MLDAARDEADLDALLRDWSLSQGDLDEIRRARGLGRLWTALHLCSLRRTGRFADAPERIPHEVIAHLAQQIDIHPPARLSALPRQASDSAIRARVREYLGFVPFSADDEARLNDSLAELTLDGLGSAELVERAEAVLLTARVVLPARGALERLVASLNRPRSAVHTRRRTILRRDPRGLRSPARQCERQRRGSGQPGNHRTVPDAIGQLNGTLHTHGGQAAGGDQRGALQPA